MHHLTRPQGRIAYDLYGAGNTGPLVVCVPGMFDHRHSFRFVGADLAEAGYRVAVMDLRGHGDSDTTFDDHTSRAAATDVLALAEELGGEDVVVVGNSLGAGAAAIAAKERPDLVAGIALLGPFLGPPSQGLFTRVGQRLLLLRPWGPRALTAVYDQLHTGRKPEGHRRQLELVLEMLRPADRYRAVYRTVYAPNETVSDAGGMRARAVVVMGELDPDWKDPRAQAERVASVVGGSVLMVPECGHYAHAQRPDVVVPAVEALLQEVVAGA
ncbi:alpha/beta fold hydrolase [Nocardiopsis dassonvillei]|uniref:alpha/beta fold hydrolase n=1 Tax=Nocardiopsis dassonvillei TaxID=2014 RepID=UPI00157D84CD|nr:alpha/beta hydrolase [Nocardiopsis dassonvillei]